MDIRCNFSDDRTCSELFDDVAVYVTAIHAVVAAIVILTSIPLNILLITSMIVYRIMFDASVVLIIASLFANIVTSLFFTGGVFLTTAARAWLLGPAGCKVFAFLALMGAITRWITIGFLSLDRFCRVFLPYCYPRHDRSVVTALLVISLVIAIGVPSILIAADRIGFNATYPTCYGVPDYEVFEILRTIGIEVASAVLLSILPTVLYTALYCKGKRSIINRVQPTVSVENSQDTSGETSLSRQRAKRAVLTYFLLLASVNVVTALAILKLVVNILLTTHDVSPSVSAGLFYVMTMGKDSYVYWDIAILITNQYHRSVLIKFLKKIKLIYDNRF